MFFCQRRFLAFSLVQVSTKFGDSTRRIARDTVPQNRAKNPEKVNTVRRLNPSRDFRMFLRALSLVNEIDPERASVILQPMQVLEEQEWISQT